MSDEGCAQVEAVVRALGSDRRPAAAQTLRELPGAEACLVRGLERAAEGRDWLAFERYVVAVFERPTAWAVPVLGRVLSERNEELNNEDIVEVLGEIGDPASVPALTDALTWMPEWDEFHALALKSVRALGAIAAEESTRVLRGAAETSVDVVRDAASAELRRRSAGG